MNRRLLYSAAFLRALATGMLGVMLGIHLGRLDLSSTWIGLIIGAGLGGGALSALLVTLYGDRFGRRRWLLLLALLGAVGAVATAAAAHPLVLAAAAFLGMLNGMGRDRGASLVLDQSILPATTDDAGRTGVFARYNVLQDIGHAFGGLLAGLPGWVHAVRPEVTELGGGRLALLLYGALILATGVIYWSLSPAVEAPAAARRARRPPVSPATRGILARLSSLFAIDAVGGGFLTTALVAYFFFKRFGVDEGLIGLLFFGARAMNALSHFGAAWLARRIGLVNTMVFTHIPSSLLLVTVAFAPSFPIAALLFLLREGLVEMDVPTRQSYVMAVVRPEERTLAGGVTSLVRMAGWAVAPSFAGLFMSGGSYGVPLVIGAGMKIGYDILLYAAFRRVKPPEER